LALNDDRFRACERQTATPGAATRWCRQASRGTRSRALSASRRKVPAPCQDRSCTWSARPWGVCNRRAWGDQSGYRSDDPPPHPRRGPRAAAAPRFDA